MRSRLTAVLLATFVAISTFGSTRAFAEDKDKASREEKKEEEEKRPQWLYLSTEAGAQRASLEAFLIDDQGASYGFRDKSAVGPMLGVGAGVRFLVLTLGPRARFGLLDNFDLITVGGELGLRPPFGIFEPHLDLGGGYASVSQMESPTRGRELSADGGYARVSGGLDVHVTRGFTVGASAGWEIFGVTPDGVSLTDAREMVDEALDGDANGVENKVRGAEGSGWGTAISLGVTLGLHY